MHTQTSLGYRFFGVFFPICQDCAVIITFSIILIYCCKLFAVPGASVLKGTAATRGFSIRPFVLHGPAVPPTPGGGEAAEEHETGKVRVEKGEAL